MKEFAGYIIILHTLLKITIHDIWFLRYGVTDRHSSWETDIILCHIGHIFALLPTPTDIIILLMCTINGNHMIYVTWDIKRGRQNFLSFWATFYFFTHPNNLKNPNFEKLKKATGGIIILHKRTKNYGQMMYGSLDMVLDGCNYFSFWTIFYPFTPLITRKIKIKKKMKNTCRYHNCTYVYPKLWSDDVRFLRYGAWQMQLLFLILGYFLPFYPPNSLKKSKFSKNEKNTGRTEKVTYRGGYPTSSPKKKPQKNFAESLSWYKLTYSTKIQKSHPQT